MTVDNTPTALTACQQEVARLTQERDENYKLAAENQDLFLREEIRRKAAEADRDRLKEALNKLTLATDALALMTNNGLADDVINEALAALGGQSNEA